MHLGESDTALCLLLFLHVKPRRLFLFFCLEKALTYCVAFRHFLFVNITFGTLKWFGQ